MVENQIYTEKFVKEKYMTKIKDLLKELKKGKVIVIGDLILDHFIWGKVDRISPEAPVPVVRVTRENQMPGGCANVALNIKALGGKVVVCGVVGKDVYGHNLLSFLKKSGIGTEGISIDAKRPTTLKTRVIAQHQHVVRVDKEEIRETDDQIIDKVCEIVKKKVKTHNVIIFSDYAKGFITKKLKDAVLQEISKKDVLLLADPKVKNIELFKNFYLVTPNKKEAIEAAGVEDVKTEKELISVGNTLINNLSLKNLLITRGEEGMSLFVNGRHIRIPTFAQEVFDVSGAGDTVIASLATALSAGIDIVKSAIIANIAASVVVGKMGTATTSTEEIAQKWESMDKNVKKELEHLL